MHYRVLGVDSLRIQGPGEENYHHTSGMPKQLPGSVAKYSTLRNEMLHTKRTET